VRSGLTLSDDLGVLEGLSLYVIPFVWGQVVERVLHGLLLDFLAMTPCCFPLNLTRSDDFHLLFHFDV